MPKKVHEAQGDQRFAALPQNLGGSGTIDGSAAEKMGLLTQNSSDFLKIGSLETQETLRELGGFSISPINHLVHFSGEQREYRVIGVDSVTVTDVDPLSTVSVNGSMLNISSTNVDGATFKINGVPVEIGISPIVFQEPILEKGEKLVAFKGVRSKFLSVSLENQPKEIVNNITNLEWKIVAEPSGVETVSTTEGTTKNITVSENDTYLKVSVRLISASSGNSPWSNDTHVYFQTDHSWKRSEEGNGSRHGCFSGDLVVFDFQDSKKAMVGEDFDGSIGPVRIIDAPEDSREFMFNPHELANGDIVSICFGRKDQERTGIHALQKNGELCIFNSAASGYLVEEPNLGSVQGAPVGSKKAIKMPRLIKDGVVYRSDEFAISVSGSGTRLSGVVRSRDSLQSLGFYSYSMISVTNYGLDVLELIDGVLDVDSSEDGQKFIYVDGNTNSLKMATKDSGSNSFIHEDILVGRVTGIINSVKFLNNERFAILSEVRGEESYLHVVNLDNKELVLDVRTSYFLASNGVGEVLDIKIKTDYQRERFFISNGFSYTVLTVADLELETRFFEVIKYGAAYYDRSGRVSKISSDGRRLMNISESWGRTSGTPISENSYFEISNVEKDDSIPEFKYPVSAPSFSNSSQIAGFSAVHTAIGRRSGFYQDLPLENPEDEYLSCNLVTYSNPGFTQFYYKLDIFDIRTGEIKESHVLKTTTGGYFGGAGAKNSSWLHFSPGAKTITISTQHLVSGYYGNGYGRALAFERRNNVYVQTVEIDAGRFSAGEQLRTFKPLGNSGLFIGSTSTGNGTVYIVRKGSAIRNYTITWIANSQIAPTGAYSLTVGTELSLFPDSSGEHLIVSTSHVNYSLYVEFWKINLTTFTGRADGYYYISSVNNLPLPARYYGIGDPVIYKGNLIFLVGDVGSRTDLAVVMLMGATKLALSLYAFMDVEDIRSCGLGLVFFDELDDNHFYVVRGTPTNNTVLTKYELLPNGIGRKLERKVLVGTTPETATILKNSGYLAVLAKSEDQDILYNTYKLED